LNKLRKVRVVQAGGPAQSAPAGTCSKRYDKQELVPKNMDHQQAEHGIEGGLTSYNINHSDRSVSWHMAGWGWMLGEKEQCIPYIWPGPKGDGRTSKHQAKENLAKNRQGRTRGESWTKPEV